MAETPQEFYERVSAAAAAQPDGRLAVNPALVDSEIFPIRGDNLRVAEFAPPVVPEPPLSGDPGGSPCGRCANGDDGAIWANERWLVSPVGGIDALPVALFLEPREHLDMDDLDASMSAEMGQLCIAIHRAIGALEHIGRVHMYVWGDGARHFHVWFLARPLGHLQLRGSSLADWTDLLPPVPPDLRAADERRVADGLVAAVGGSLVS
jgi:hypothetical protein